jgi:hypothetical protein
VALTLQQAEDEVRAKTRHQSDTVRLTQAVLRAKLNRVYRELRSWLADKVPTHPSNAIATSGLITLPDDDGGLEVSLRSDSYAYDKLFLVEWRSRQTPDVWVPVDPATLPDRNQNAGCPYTFREEGGCLVFGPDWLGSDGTPVVFRVKFFQVPPVLTETDATFKIPVQLERPLLYRVSAEVAEDDGNDPQDFDGKATKLLAEAEIALKGRKGRHSPQAGLIRRRGY